MSDAMPNEDELDEALLKAARELGQCPVIVGTATTRPQRCAYVRGHEGDHAPNQFQFQVTEEQKGIEPHEEPQEPRSESTQQKRCPPACSCPPGTHSSGGTHDHWHWYVRNNVEILSEDRLALDDLKASGILEVRENATALTDSTCAACPSVILAGARCVVDGPSPNASTYHPGCWASKLYHEERGLPFPPLRGQHDGKALDRAATAEVGGHKDHTKADVSRGSIWDDVVAHLKAKGVPYTLTEKGVPVIGDDGG